MEAKAAGGDIQVPWTLFELRRAWNRAKHEVAPWSGLDGLARALKTWQDSKQGVAPDRGREYRCEHGGMVLDRDLNAARNLAALVASTTNGFAGSGPETGNARGWGQGLPFGGFILDEAGSRHQVLDLG
jgi:hypothetical protein